MQKYTLIWCRSIVNAKVPWGTIVHPNRIIKSCATVIVHSCIHFSFNHLDTISKQTAEAILSPALARFYFTDFCDFIFKELRRTVCNALLQELVLVGIVLTNTYTLIYNKIWLRSVRTPTLTSKR